MIAIASHAQCIVHVSARLPIACPADAPIIVVAAIDCGVAVNPQLIAQQLESSILYGLSAALYGRISFKDGQVEQGNFDAYPVIRLAESPSIDTWIVPSTAPPGGVGEPGVPPVAPAVTSALAKLTGRRVRRLPLVGA